MRRHDDGRVTGARAELAPTWRQGGNGRAAGLGGTFAHLVAAGPDGREAAGAGLKELERYGYLVRERLRRANGTLGEVVY
ncbi:hypothetical protein [Streptomyces sp. CA-106110]|uniref:hypothetical protein n=1 Tax=Streptomyces sp. CA-106110 TaxID=3240044 RepID=UPI003D8EEF0F